MNRFDYINQYSKKLGTIELLKTELREMEKKYLEENKPIKCDLPVKIHYVHTIPGYMEGNEEVKSGDGFLVGFKVFNPTYTTFLTGSSLPLGIIYPVFNLPKKDGSVMSSREHHYPKYGTLKYWVIGKEDEVFEIYFGK